MQYAWKKYNLFNTKTDVKSFTQFENPFILCIKTSQNDPDEATEHS